MTLIPLDNTILMAKLFTAQTKFNAKICEASFYQDIMDFPMPDSAAKYAEEWKRLGDQRAGTLQRHIARIQACDEAGFDLGHVEPDSVWPNGTGEPSARIGAFEKQVPKFRPVLIVHRCSHLILRR